MVESPNIDDPANVDRRLRATTRARRNDTGRHQTGHPDVGRDESGVPVVGERVRPREPHGAAQVESLHTACGSDFNRNGPGARDQAMDEPIVDVRVPQVVETGTIPNQSRLRVERDMKGRDHFDDGAFGHLPRKRRKVVCVTQEVPVSLQVLKQIATSTRFNRTTIGSWGTAYSPFARDHETKKKPVRRAARERTTRSRVLPTVVLPQVSG